MDFFERDELTAIQAKEEAQRIAFAPFVFQATRVLRDSGILKALFETQNGLTFSQIIDKVSMPEYGVRVLVEAGLGMKLITLKDNLYQCTKIAYFILNDELTRVNMDFVHDVCYQGMFYLEASIHEERPEGLKVLGQWPTIYEGLSKLPKHIQKSWFGFDHYYSDTAFPYVLPVVYKHKPKKLLDIGGNTGKWALQSFEFDKDVQITIMDLPGQVEMAHKHLHEKGFGDRISFLETNILDESNVFPKGFDAVWMSQFLDCFSEAQIISILNRCRTALLPDGSIYILETFWDRQRFQASAFSLQQTSLYFTAMANGNSQMYDSKIFKKCVEAAGLNVAEEHDEIGVSHTLLICKPKP
jgi:ubiquinone/menaquinone biosynthesis C-methylase UbiE